MMLAKNVQREIERDLNLQSEAAMANSDAGTSSGSAGGGKYQVFLNFCGRDTRGKFTSFLHRDLRNNGIHAFMDDDELRVGEEIGVELRQAIDNSQIYVPIFSENYASRKWCLRELVRMVDNISKSEEKKILPIFYYVEPDDVDLKTESYRKAIGELKKEHEKKQQERLPHEVESWEGESWEEALMKVGKIKGWVLQQGKNEAELVDSIVKVVLQELKIRCKSVTKSLVGLNDRVAEVREKLDINCSDEVRLLIIYGMGGIGKTTLAEVVYNKLFSHFGKHCAFLDNVREMSKKDLLSLQKKLLTDIDSSSAGEIIKDVDHGRQMIERTLGIKKVLIVLDDVDEEKQIKNLIGQDPLYPGIRIIITTRNASVLELIKQRTAPKTKEVNSDPAIRILPYEMKEMNFDDALLLFKRHASPEGSLPKGFDSLSFDSLSRDIVITAGGLPLALQVTGSSLYEKPKPTWVDTLERLRKIPHEHVLKTLKISFEALEDHRHHQDIFLDIACFFTNDDIINASYMWWACEFYPDIEVLVRRSLIKIIDNKFWMHDQLRDLGREIVCEENSKNPGKRSRLWTSEILDFVSPEERYEDVEAIDLQEWPSSISIEPEKIGVFKNLRFLRLSNVSMKGDIIVNLPKLRWISWRSPFQIDSGPSMRSKNLVVLELFDNHFKDDSKVWDLIKMATKLKSLALVKCRDITRTPDLSKCLALERLTFHGCWSLTVIDSSITKLTCLLYLDITHCGLVEHVPNDIGSLKKLEHFSLKRCLKVGGLPPSIGNLASLRQLDLSMTRITSLPDSIGKLGHLLVLNLLGLEITELPNIIEGLVELQRLYLKDTKIRQLPNSIGKLISLRTLDLSKTNIEGGIDQWKLPKAIGMLDKLEELYLGRRYELVGKIPDEIGDLSSLRVLDLCRTRICQIPGTINKLSCLLTLDLIQCNKIKELPKLPTSLVCLHVESHSLEVVPNLSELTNLMELFLSDGSGPDFCTRSNLMHMCDLRWIERLSKLEKLTLYLLNGATLPTESGPYPRLKYHDLCWQLPPSLLSLELNYFSLTGSLLSNLKILSNLTLRFSRVQEMQLHGLLQLQYLQLRACNLKSLSIPSSLRTLAVIKCPNMIEIQFLGKSASLEELSIESCQSIGRIVLRGEVGSLGVLNQSESSLRESNYCSLEVLPNALKKLKKLKLQHCDNIREIQVIGTLFSLQDINISWCGAMVKLSDVSNLKNLQSLEISDCYKLRFVEGLDELEFLSNLCLSCCPSLETLLDRSNSKILERCLIKVHKCGELPNSSSYGPITFKRYKRMAQQGAPQPEKKKERAKMEGDAEEPNSEPQLRFHPFASSQDHDISKEPPVDNVKEGTLSGSQNQTRQQDSNLLSISPLSSTELQFQLHPYASSHDHEINEGPPIDDVRQGTPPGNQNQTKEQDSNPRSNSQLSSTELQLQFYPSGSRDHDINEEPPIDDVREGTPPRNQNQTREQDSNPQSLDERARPTTFSDSFKSCLLSILECVCNRDFT